MGNFLVAVLALHQNAFVKPDALDIGKKVCSQLKAFRQESFPEIETCEQSSVNGHWLVKAKWNEMLYSIEADDPSGRVLRFSTPEKPDWANVGHDVPKVRRWADSALRVTGESRTIGKAFSLDAETTIHVFYPLAVNGFEFFNLAPRYEFAFSSAGMLIGYSTPSPIPEVDTAKAIVTAKQSILLAKAFFPVISAQLKNWSFADDVDLAVNGEPELGYLNSTLGTEARLAWKVRYSHFISLKGHGGHGGWAEIYIDAVTGDRLIDQAR